MWRGVQRSLRSSNIRYPILGTLTQPVERFERGSLHRIEGIIVIAPPSTDREEEAAMVKIGGSGELVIDGLVSFTPPGDDGETFRLNSLCVVLAQLTIRGITLETGLTEISSNVSLIDGTTVHTMEYHAHVVCLNRLLHAAGVPRIQYSVR